MEKWKKNFTLALLSASFAFLVPLSAEADYCDPCNTHHYNFGGLEVNGDFLFWKPSVDDMDYAAQLTILDDVAPGDSYEQEIAYRKLGLDWNPGYRIGVAINDIWCEWRFSSSYTNLTTSDTSETSADSGTVVVSPLQFAALTNPNYYELSSSGGFKRVKGKIDIQYQTWDFLMSRIICSSECYTIEPFIGAEGLILNQKIRTHSTLWHVPMGAGTGNGHAKTNWNSDFNAYGLKFGTDYIFQLGDCLKFFTRGSFTIASGENKGKNKQQLTRNSEDSVTGSQAVARITEKEDESSQFVNGYNIQLGFIYETDLCGYDFGVRLGYEFVKWHNVPRPRRFPGGDNGEINAYNRSISTSPSKSTIGFQGLLAGASVSF